MKKVNNKGFSLVEILAAIVILGVLMTLAANAYNVYKKDARQQAYDTMAKTATTAAENYMMENAKPKYISLSDLQDGQYIDTLQDPKYKDEQCSGIVINKVIQGEEDKKLDMLFQKVKLCCKEYKYQYDYTGDEVVVTEIDSCEYKDGDEIHGMYKLNFKPNGGTPCEPPTLFKKEKEKWGPLCVTTRENFAFKGWNTKKNGSGTTITEDSIVGDKDISVYAKWNEIFNLTFNEEGGSACDPKTIRKENGEKWGTLCNTTREGYAFKGWRTEINGGGTKITSESSAERNLNLYAHWNPYITITFNTQGGTACNPSSITKEKGVEWGTLCTPTKNGYVFKGWNTRADGSGETITSTTKAATTMTLYAIWNPLYTITYNSNGGTACNPNSKTVENGKQWGALCTTQQAGFTFVRWKDEQGNTINTTTVCNRNLNVTAEWRANCPSGYTYQSNGTCVKVYNATLKYKCNTGDILTGTTCTHTTSYAATVSYSCPNGGTLSGSKCNSSSSYNASVSSYTCPSGGTLSGSTCSTSSSYPATSSSSYSNCRWVKDSGHTSTKASSQNGAVWSATCSSSNVGEEKKFYDCGKGKVSCRNPNTGKYNCTSCASANMRYTYKKGVCTCDKSTSYTCTNGGTRSGSTCYVSSSYDATPSYHCPSGGTLSGTKCNTSSSTNATASYSCPSGGTLSSTTCTTNSTYNATGYYECNSGDTLSGSSCTNVVRP